MTSPICLDYETSAGGRASLDYFRDDFQVDSIALTWREGDSLKSLFYDDPRYIKAAMKKLHETQRPVIVHNLMFELGVTASLWPELNINWQYDTLRMCLLREGEGSAKDVAESSESMGFILGTASKQEIGLGLEKCVKRYLPVEHHNHKAEAHNWLEENHGVTKKHGMYLDKLPRDVLERYNIADTETTYLLFEDCQRYFESINYKDRTDWMLYSCKTRLFCESKIHGFPIDRPGLLKYITDTEKAYDSMIDEFLEWCGEEDLAAYKKVRIERDVAKMKTEKGKVAGRKKRQVNPKFDFNPGSSQQLAEFFMTYKGIVPYIFTKEPKNRKSKKEFVPVPSTATDDLHQYGEGGKILIKKGTMKLNLNQAMGIYILSDYDGVFHPDVKSATTSTNRVKGGSDVI